MAKRIITLEEFVQKSALTSTEKGAVVLEKPVVVAGSVAADVEPVDGSKAGETKIVDSVIVDPVVGGVGDATSGV